MSGPRAPTSAVTRNSPGGSTPTSFEVTVNIKFKLAPDPAMVGTWKQDIRAPGTASSSSTTTTRTRSCSCGSSSAAARRPTHDRCPQGAAGEHQARGHRPLRRRQLVHARPRQGARTPRVRSPDRAARRVQPGAWRLFEVTGEQPYTGNIDAPKDAGGASVSPQTVAAEIRKAVTTGPANKHGAQAAAVVGTSTRSRRGRSPSASATPTRRPIAPTCCARTSPTAAGTPSRIRRRGRQRHRRPDPVRANGTLDPDENTATAPFLYSNRSLMGEMQSLSAPISPHEHPVAERHVRHFADIVVRNRRGKWQIKRR